MFYLSPTLTGLMLLVVPPVSLGAVRVSSLYNVSLPRVTGLLWSLPQEVIDQNSRRCW